MENNHFNSGACSQGRNSHQKSTVHIMVPCENVVKFKCIFVRLHQSGGFCAWVVQNQKILLETVYSFLWLHKSRQIRRMMALRIEWFRILLTCASFPSTHYALLRGPICYFQSSQKVTPAWSLGLGMSLGSSVTQVFLHSLPGQQE